MYCIFIYVLNILESQEDRTVLKYFQTFFNAFFTKDRISKLKEEYGKKHYDNLIKKYYELN